MEPMIGQIILFGGNFAPDGWAFCDGQTLEVEGNEALFAILGDTYGGDGRLTFRLPDLRGRVPMHAGHAPTLSPREIGQTCGTEQVALTAKELPEHRHEILASENAPDAHSETGSSVSAGNIHVNARTGAHRQSSDPTIALNSKTIGLTGESAPHNNMQPTLCINYIIATGGVFPTRG